MTSSTHALRPCPFCGYGNLRDAVSGLFYVECKDCGAYGPSHDEGASVGVWAQSAKAKWNTRSMGEAPANVVQDVPGSGPVMVSGAGGARALPEPTGASLASREIERMESECQDGARTAETPETGALRACPFCGSDNIREAGRGLFYAECRDCHAYGPSHDEDSPYGLWAQQANEKWNRRTP